LLIPRDPAAPVGVPQQFRFRAVEGVSAAYSVSPEPINEFFRSTGWPGDKPMSAAPAFVFWQLESQLRRGSSIIGDRVALRFDAGVPADALHRGFDLLARINDGVEPRDQKQLALQIEVAPASNDDNTGDAPLPRVVPGANALTALQVRATHRVIVQAVEPDAALVPPSRPIDDSATPAPAGDVRHSGQHVLLALKWLRDHQADDGSWDPVEFGAAGNAHGRTTGRYGNVNGTGDTGWKQARAGVTGIALLAFLGAGYTHTEGEFANTVKKALRYLKLIQDNDGVFDTTNRADTHYIYGHAICSLAMVEAFALTGSNILKGPAQKALDFIAAAQNKVGDLTGGWRYGIRPGDSDTSITAWMALALHSARVAGLKVPADGMAGAVRHMELMTASVNGYPKTGYIAAGGSNARLQEQARFAPNPTTDAMNVLVRILASDGEARENAVLVAQSRVITSIDNRPTLRNPDKIDYYYWHWASLAMFQMGGEYWTDWQRPLADALARSQRLEGGRESDRCYGSWDTNSAWGVAGGRVYTTAINCLTLESYFRYERMAVRQRADNNADGGR
ncbi:MAG: prenyltransferase/squalene oxidase repeat-containing protein, partial [Planctomycetota bacterium]